MSSEAGAGDGAGAGAGAAPKQDGSETLVHTEQFDNIIFGQAGHDFFYEHRMNTFFD